MKLKEYRQKRNFKNTPEPTGHKLHSPSKSLQFVVQEHHASHLHYDFRLEFQGVLKSWAIPKGPSLNPAEKRLAIQVEDHPFEYRTFEGTIPEGQYGAGTVKIWDKGTYQAEGATTLQESEELIKKGFQEGRLNFIIEGEKLKGSFSLIQLKGDKKEQWLLIKKKDQFANESPFYSSKINHSSKPTGNSSSKKKENNYQTSLEIQKLNFVKPMLATLIDQPFDDKNWLFEIKWDGYRALADIQKEQVHLYSRNFQLFDRYYPDLIHELHSLQINALIDGEIVVLDDENRPSFQWLQNYPRTQKGTLAYYVFDLLNLEGYDICALPLIERKNLLKKLLPDQLSYVHLCNYSQEKGKAFFKNAVEKGFEGIIGKQAQSSYQQGRSHDWVKIKTRGRQEAIICGFSSPKGKREKFGSLLLGAYDRKKLVYIGHTGSGFNRQQLNEIHKRLQPLIQESCPFSYFIKPRSPVTWVKPKLICEVNFAEWTKDHRLRQAVFVGIREDKQASEVVRESPISSKELLNNYPNNNNLPTKLIKSKKKTILPSSTEWTHLDKIYWPDEGYTKGDLIHYYQQVASFILPYLKDRPETLRRYPNGIKGTNFYQKEISQAPSWIRTEEIQHENRKVRYLFIEDERSLLYTINLGCIGLHPFNSRFQNLHMPDYLVIDLDPTETANFDHVIEVAQEVHAVLEEWKVPSVCKTSGATGMHIYIPMGAVYIFEEVKQFAQLIVHTVHERCPNLTSLERSPEKRQKKIYLDYLQNHTIYQN